MKILLTLHEHLEPNSGAAGSILYLGEQYEALGHEVHYYSFNDLPKQVPFKLKDLFFPEFTAFKLWMASRKMGFDVVDTSTGDAWVWGTFLRGSRQKSPLLVTRSHGLDHLEHLERLEDVKRGDMTLSWIYPLYRGSIQLWEIATSLRCADLCFFLNRQDLTYAVTHLGVAPERVQVFPNGLPDEFLNLPWEPTPQGPEEPIRIAQIGTYVQRKGVQYGAVALNSILKRYPNVEVSFVGTELNGFGTVEEVYADFDPSVQNRVHVISYFDHAKLPELLRGHHIKLFPTLSEGFGKALIEAMACGLAPVTTNAPGPMEIVQDGEDGMIVPLRDSAAIEQALERLICDRNHLDTLRRKAYQTAQNYSWLRIAKDRLSAYETALRVSKHV